jgi:hypothetical protein
MIESIPVDSPLDADAGDSLSLEYASLGVRITCRDAAPLAWLQEFVTPAFRLGAGGALVQRDVALEFDRARYADLVRSRPEHAADIDCFTLDQRFARCPFWLDESGHRLIHDIQAEAIYVVADRAGSLRILAASDTAAARLALLRVVRELATAYALRQGQVHLHAAAVEVQGTVVAIAGPRRSGKSTLLLHALASGAASYVTGDRLLVGQVGDRLEARGMPTIVALREGTVDYFPELRSRLVATAYEWSGTERRPDERGRGISPAQLCALMEVKATPSGPLGVIVFPRIVPAVSSYDLRVLSPEEAAGCVRTSMFLAAVPERTAAAFAGDAPPVLRDESALQALSAGIAERVCCIDLRLGVDAYGTGRQIGEVTTAWEAIRAASSSMRPGAGRPPAWTSLR